MKKTAAIVFAVLLLFVLALCLVRLWTGRDGAEAAESAPPAASETPAEETTAPTSSLSPTAAPTPVPAQTPSPTPEPTEPPVTVTVYVGSAASGAFAATTDELKSLTPENLAAALSSAGVLPGSASVVSFSTYEHKYYGEVIDLELGSSFASQLDSTDEAGKYFLLGSVVNTFLKAYGADAIGVSSGGQQLTSGASGSGGYMTMFTDSGAPTPEPTEGPDLTLAESIVSLANSLIGAPYEWGAAGPETFDNSGFVHYCFAQNGVEVPRTTYGMFDGGTEIAESDLRAGDLVFFTYEEDRSASYVGIYLGGGEFIAENNEDSPVCTHDMTQQYYKDIYVGARRYF